MQSQEGALSEQTSNFQVEKRAMVSIDGRKLKVPNFLAAEPGRNGSSSCPCHACHAQPARVFFPSVRCAHRDKLFQIPAPLRSSSTTPHRASFSNPCPAASRLFPQTSGFHQQTVSESLARARSMAFCKRGTRQLRVRVNHARLSLRQ
jgi:hypothetical protein